MIEEKSRREIFEKKIEEGKEVGELRKRRRRRREVGKDGKGELERKVRKE